MLAAVAPIRPLAWEHSYAASAALKSKKKNQKQTNNVLSTIPWAMGVEKIASASLNVPEVSQEYFPLAEW